MSSSLVEVVIALGSNLGDRGGQMWTALKSLRRAGMQVRLMGPSPAFKPDKD